MKNLIKLALLTLSISNSMLANFGQACAASGLNYNDCISYVNELIATGSSPSQSFQQLALVKRKPAEGCQKLGIANCAAAMQAQCQGSFCSF